MNENIFDLLFVLLLFCGICVLIAIGYLLFICYKKIKYRDNPIGITEPFFNIKY